MDIVVLNDGRKIRRFANEELDEILQTCQPALNELKEHLKKYCLLYEAESICFCQEKGRFYAFGVPFEIIENTHQ